MAWGAHVGVDASVSTVCAPTHFWGLVHLDVFNHKRVHIQTLQGVNEREKKQAYMTIRPVLGPIYRSFNLHEFYFKQMIKQPKLGSGGGQIFLKYFL